MERNQRQIKHQGYHTKPAHMFAGLSNAFHVYFVHPSNNISVDIYRPIVNRCIGRYIDRHSTDMSTDIYTDTLPIYQLRYVGRHIGRYTGTGIGRLLPGTRTDMSVDMLTESGCLIVGRHVDREATDILPILHWYFSLATGDCTLCKPM